MMNIAIGVVVVLLALAVAIVTRPKTFRVERSAVMSAPADAIFRYVNDFHLWARWSPFEKLDPNLTRTFSGADAGVGARYDWSGNRQAGSGSMVITESVPGARIALDLHFMKPFEATNLTEFTFEPAPGGVKMTWAMSGNNTTAGKVIALVSSMDKMVGSSFAEGLANLKSVVEAESLSG